MEYSDKRVLVTGSSRGIGRAIAIALGKMGYEVIVHCAGRIEKGQETCDIITSNEGRAMLVQADLGKADGAVELLKKAGPVDVLVLNASVQFRNQWEKITPEEFDIQVNCNFRSSLMLIQQAVPHMRETGWGRIVTIGSVQEAKPHPDMLVYSATKAAQTNMVQSLALQLAGSGITVNNVAPGVIYTDRNFEALSDPVYAKKVTDSIPVGYYGKPEDVAHTVKLLCSEEGRYITGQSIYVDGGKSIQ